MDQFVSAYGETDPRCAPGGPMLCWTSSNTPGHVVTLICRGGRRTLKTPTCSPTPSNFLFSCADMTA